MDMRPLVRSRPIEGLRIATKDNVSERDRGNAAWERRQVCQGPLEERPMDFNDGVDDSHTAMPQGCDGEYQAERGCRCGP
jgi:hypothetical protein